MLLSGKLPRFRCGFLLLENSGNFPHLDDYMREHVLLKTEVEEGSCQSRGKCAVLVRGGFDLLLSAADRPSKAASA
jgi:hypothetical protein